METNEILEKVSQIFRKILKNETLLFTLETTAQDIDEWDSLNHTILLLETQKYFDVKFKLKEVMQFKNMGDMCLVIKQRLNEKSN